jgi:hypothetical protein
LKDETESRRDCNWERWGPEKWRGPPFALGGFSGSPFHPSWDAWLQLFNHGDEL